MRYLYVIVTIVNLLILIYIFGKFYVLFEYTFCYFEHLRLVEDYILEANSRHWVLIAVLRN